MCARRTLCSHTHHIFVILPYTQVAMEAFIHCISVKSTCTALRHRRYLATTWSSVTSFRLSTIVPRYTRRKRLLEKR